MMQRFKFWRTQMDGGMSPRAEIGEEFYLCPEADACIAELEKDAARYRWLRDGNAYKPEGQCINGGEELDELCDNGLMVKESQ